jgi:hypothetical protein
MKTASLLIVVLILASGIALAENPLKIEDTTPLVTTSREDCITEDYNCYTWLGTYEIPDNDPEGLLIGPMVTAPGYTIDDVILFLDITHTWIGDLRVLLYYDADCDGVPETEGGVLCRHTLDGCPVDNCCGCGGDLNGYYGFDDAVASIEDECPAAFPPGCYGPDYDSAGLDVFNGLASGGCFWLFVADGAGADVGELREWSVCVLPGYGAALDIKPTSCPNPINVKSQGKMPAAILGSETFDVYDIDPETIMLEGVVEPLRWHYSDVATPVGTYAEPCECNELGPDGYTDLTLKFLTQDVVGVLGPYEDGDYIELTVSFELYDGTEVWVSDCVWVLDKGKETAIAPVAMPDTGPSAKEPAESASWATIKALYR